MAPLRTGASPAWLVPWIRTDFAYCLVQPLLDIADSSEPTMNEGEALVSLATDIAGSAARWYVVSGRADSASPWEDTHIAPTYPAAAVADVAAARRGSTRISVVLTPVTGAPPASMADLLAAATLVMVVLDTWDAAVIGARDLLTEAGRIGAHVQLNLVDPPISMGRVNTRRHAWAARSRTIGITAAAVIAMIVFAEQQSSDLAVESASPVPTRSNQPGLLLPSATRFPGGRTGASASFDPLTGTVTLFGGGRLGGASRSDLFPRDTWTWDVNGWRRRDTTDAPPSASDAAFAYDEATGSALLFGGIGGDGSTWQWNGLKWQQLSPRRHPAPNVFASAVFDQRRGAVVLATVCCQTSQADTGAALATWEWRHFDWVRQRTRDAPVLFRAPLITYDVAHGALLLLTQGSTPATTNTDRITTSSTLWIQHGATWRRARTRTSPPYDPLRDRFGYDPAIGQAVLFQGGDLPTWTWDGTTWHDLPASGPSYSGAMTADATVGRILLFGGQVASDDLSAVWTLESGRWKKVSGR